MIKEKLEKKYQIKEISINLYYTFVGVNSIGSKSC